MIELKTGFKNLDLERHEYIINLKSNSNMIVKISFKYLYVKYY